MFRKTAVVALLAFLFSSQAISQLNGPYTLGPPDSLPDFTTFDEFVDTLHSASGISGPVVLNVLPGIYEVHREIFTVVGNDQTNTITIQGSTGDSTKSIFYYNYPSSSETNYIIGLVGIQYVTIKSLTFDATSGSSSYCTAIKITSAAHHINIQNCVFHGKPRDYYDAGTLIFSYDNIAEYIVIENNVFNNGERAARFDNNSTYARGNVFSNNICIDQENTAFEMENQNAPKINNNYIRNSKSGKEGIYLRNLSNNYEVHNNDVRLWNPSEIIVLNACDGGASMKGTVFNNFIIGPGSGSNNHGLRLLNSDHVQVYHNSVYIYNGWREDSKAFYQDGGSNIDIRNNIFANHNGGYAYYCDDPGSISTSDYNNYYATGNYLARWGSGEKLDLAELAAAHGGDNNSISTFPVFVSGSDLHTSNFRLEAKGDPGIVSIVPKDIDGDDRSGSPDLGADEFDTPTGEALSGTITVGPGQTYETITSVVNQLNAYGIDGPLNINLLAAGSPYEEQFHFLPVTGADESNRVTLQPAPGDEGNVIITYNSSGTYHTILLWRASYITLKNLTISAENSTYPETVRINGYCHHDSIVGCKLSSIGTQDGRAALYAKDNKMSHIYVVGNEIIDGRTCIYMEGTSARRHENIVIQDNLIDSPYSNGIYLEYADAPKVNGNTITTGTSTYYYTAIYLYNCRFDYQVVGNKIHNLTNETGIYIRSSDGSLGKEGLIANNFIRITGSTGQDARAIYTNASDYVNIVFNSARIGYGNDYEDSEVYYNTSGSFINVMNNIFCHYGRGRAIWNNTTSAFNNCDYNCYYSTGKYIARWGSGEKVTLEQWQASSGKDANTIFADPAFMLTDDDYHVNSSFLDGKGIVFDTITVDLDGELREDPPDIGADEFSDPVTPLAGPYTIGGDSPDYLTIDDARQDLHLRGISAPVTFNIRSGEYPERLGSYYPISGANSHDTIVIQSESGNPADVIIYSADETNIGYCRGIKYFTVQNLTISSTAPSAGRPIMFRGHVKKVNIINNRLISANTSWTNVFFDGIISDSILIKDNLISSGYTGIYIYGDQNIRSTNTMIVGNDISGTSNRGIHLIYHEAPIIVNNTVDMSVNSDVNCISLEYCMADMVVSGNRLTGLRGYGLSMSNCDAVNPFYGLIKNNMISIRGTYTAGGIYLNNCDRQHVYHNTVHISSTDTYYPWALYSENTNNEIQMINNIFANSGGGRVMYIEDINDIAASDYNNLYGIGTNYIRVASTEHVDLSAFQGATGFDANSKDLEPLFYSRDELYSAQPGFYEAGTPLADVPYDIDSVSRTITTNPDMGAAEFYCETPEFNVSVSPSCFGDSTTFIDFSTNIAGGSTYNWDFKGNDFNPELTTNKPNDTVVYKFDSPGTHTVNFWVTQIAECVDNHVMNVVVNPLPALTPMTKGAYCGEDDGEAWVTITGEAGPFTYYWSTGSTDTIITGLALGTYSVAVSDTNNCTTTEDITIEEAIQVTVEETKSSTCGIPDGEAVVSATGGVEPYRYYWSDGDTSATNSHLSTGLHYVNVIDDNGCYAQGFVNISSDESGPQIALQSSTDNDCYGDRNGVLNITVTGGEPPYTYLWSNGAKTEDIDNLAAGLYDVVVTDNADCMGAGSFEVTHPTRIDINTVVEDADCAGSNGKAVAIVSGGTKPYIYNWSTGSIYQIEEGLAAGVYSVTVTDAKGCVEVEPVVVNNVGGPVPVISSVTGVSCLNPTNGAISVTVSGGQGPYMYEWSPGGQNTPSISDLSPGEYMVEVTDQAGCVGVNFAEVAQDPPAVNPICLVTVDTITNMNQVVWEKGDISEVDYYVIYRETSLKGIYQPIGTRPVDSVSIFTDSLADPSIRSWRYKLSVVDLCGNESELSSHHKTMHLTMNLGLEGSVNLIWDHYEGFEVSTYEVWRYSATTDWDNIAHMPANLTSYTDHSPPLEDLTYFIEVIRPDDCYLEDLKAGTLNSSRSNRQTRLKGTDVNDIFESLNQLSIYPNPSSGIFNISLSRVESQDVTMKVYDMSGKLVYINELNNLPQRYDTQLDLSDYTEGVYQLHLRTENAIYHRALIIK